MSIIHINQIKSYLENNVFDKIDITDLGENLSPEDKKKQLLTRSLSAYCIQCLVDEPIEKITKYVIDGSMDNGIDCIFYSDTSNILYISQAKWHDSGNKTIDKGEIQKFIKGIKDLLNSRYDKFNEKLQSFKKTIDAALQHPNTNIKLLISYSTTNDLPEELHEDIQDFLIEMNDTSEVISYEVLNQSFLHRSIVRGTDTSPINEELILENWGYISEPYEAYYGIINASILSRIYEKYERKLFVPNIRSFLTDSEINTSIEETINSNPESFFYFNNGITFTTESITKKLTSGTNRNTGIFDCINLSIINGAQTVGSIARAGKKDPRNLDNTNVLVKIISLKDAKDDFQSKVTKAANTQNTVGSRDFITQDPEQERLKLELQIEGIYYSYKRGDLFSSESIGFDFEEAISTLSNYKGDIKLVTQAKRELGVLWKDVTKAPYKILFNPTLSSIELWNIVQIQRKIDKLLEEKRNDAVEKNALFLIHGNKFLSFLTIENIISENNIKKEFIDIETLNEKIMISLDDSISRLYISVEKIYPDDYLGNLFKTVSKCQTLYEDINEKNL